MKEFNEENDSTVFQHVSFEKLFIHENQIENIAKYHEFSLLCKKLGIELNRHQVTNLINAGFPTVSLQQQPQQQQHIVTQANVKDTKLKGHRNNQQQQQQQILQQQMATPQLMAVAFPGNPQHSGNQQQQQLIHTQGGQQQHQLIAAIPNSGHSNSNRNNYNNTSTTNWACPACKSSFKSATELQAHLR